MTTIYYIKATNKVTNNTIGYVTDEVFNGVRFGTVNDVVNNQYYWGDSWNQRQGVLKTAKYWGKKFPAVNFTVEHSEIAA